MRALIPGILSAIVASQAAASGPVCFPIEEVGNAMKERGYQLTFEGFSTGGSVLVFTEKGGEWIIVLKMDDGFGCPLAAGEGYNVTIGSLM